MRSGLASVGSSHRRATDLWVCSPVRIGDPAALPCPGSPCPARGSQVLLGARAASAQHHRSRRPSGSQS